MTRTDFFQVSFSTVRGSWKKNLIPRSIYTSSPVDSATFYDPRSKFSFTFRPKQNPTWNFEGFFSEFDGFEAQNLSLINAKSIRNITYKHWKLFLLNFKCMSGILLTLSETGKLNLTSQIWIWPNPRCEFELAL